MDQVMNQGLCRTPSLVSFLYSETHVAIEHYKNDSLGGIEDSLKRTTFPVEIKVLYTTNLQESSFFFKKKESQWQPCKIPPPLY